MIHEKHWVQAANQWIIAYTFVQEGMLELDFSGYVFSPHLFLLGHALELYLKACLAKRGEDVWGHDLIKMWECLKGDPAFVPEISITREQFEDFDLAKSDNNVTNLQYQTMKMLMKYTADLKYLGTRLKKVQGCYSYVWLSYDPAVARMFSGLRKYVPLPDGHLDSLTAILHDPKLSPNQREFIREITS